MTVHQTPVYIVFIRCETRGAVSDTERTRGDRYTSPEERRRHTTKMKTPIMKRAAEKNQRKNFQ